ncbi:MAG TPA: hypothetical protein VFP98_09925 [Candidatus Polarisedimenticolia bacterium]|nr:hypothetical protein [Candidatus Polarisedimenticolia bacterium]
MRVLIADCPASLRDQIHVGLDAFATFQVDTASGSEAMERLRRYEFDLVILGIGADRDAADRFLGRLFEQKNPPALIVVAKEVVIQELRGCEDRARFFTLLEEPLEPVGFFRAIHRFLQRRTMRGLRGATSN